MMALCAGLLVGCDKEPIIPEEPVKPPMEQPGEPEQPSKPEEPEEPESPTPVLPSTENILNLKIGDTNMIVGTCSWKSITYGNRKYVAVSSISGSNCYTASSTDGINWTHRVNGTNEYWKCITFGNGKFVVVGNGSSGGFITSSTDGISWTRTNIGTYWESVTYGNGKYVAIDSNGNTTTSTDGINWTTLLTISSNNWKSITFGNGRYVAVSSINSSKPQAAVSTDGVNWTLFTTTGFPRSANKIIYANGLFIAVGYNEYAMISEDGESWRNSQIKDESGNVVTAQLNGVCAMP